MATYFYDSYAVIEYLRGNKNYAKYFEQHEGVLTHMNLIEIHQALLRASSGKDADSAAKAFFPLVVIPDMQTILEASRLKLKNKRMSYADVTGYVYAKFAGIKFLTGDKEFKGMENTEFVK